MTYILLVSLRRCRGFRYLPSRWCLLTRESSPKETKLSKLTQLYFFSHFILLFSSGDVYWRKVITITFYHGKGQSPFDQRKSMSGSMTPIEFCFIKRHLKNMFLHRRIFNKITGLLGPVFSREQIHSGFVKCCRRSVPVMHWGGDTQEGELEVAEVKMATGQKSKLVGSASSE